MADKKLVDGFVFFGPVGNVGEFSRRTDKVNERFEFDVFIETGYESGKSLNSDTVIRADDAQIGG